MRCTRCSGSSSERRDNLGEDEKPLTTKSPSTEPYEEPVKIFDFSRFIMIFMALLAIWAMFDNEMRMALGAIVGLLFYPLFGFHGKYILLTIFFSSITMASFSSSVTFYHTDMVEQARAQKIVAEFNKVLREARMANKTTRVNKLMKMQPEIMQLQTKAMGGQYKVMAYTMVIFISVFAWLYLMVSALPYKYITVPWSMQVYLLDKYVLQVWVLLYSLMSIPFGFMIRNMGRIHILRNELRKMEE